MRFLGLLVFAAGCASAPKIAATPQLLVRPPAVARTIDLELTDTTPAGAKTTHYVLSVVDDQGWSRMSEQTATEHLALQASSNLDKHNGFPAIIRVELRRNSQGEPAVDLAQSTIFFAGRRTVLGHVDGANGSTEIAMVTR
ncbi:MAG TPA: hypothetical protein VGH28_05550 [Polyangiaceae bacterium]